MAAWSHLLRQWERTLALTLFVLAPVAIGFAIGWSTGQAGLDSVVLAAVLPAILTGVAGGAGALMYRLATSDSDTANFAWISFPAGAVILFSVSFVFGADIGSVSNERALNRETNEAARLRSEAATKRYEYVVQCTDQLVRINTLRRKVSSGNSRLSLEPLTIEQVCIALAPLTPPEFGLPYAALAAQIDLSQISEYSVEKHYQYLERCTVNQAKAINDMSNEENVPFTIEQICPALGQ